MNDSLVLVTGVSGLSARTASCRSWRRVTGCVRRVRSATREAEYWRCSVSRRLPIWSRMPGELLRVRLRPPRGISVSGGAPKDGDELIVPGPRGGAPGARGGPGRGVKRLVLTSSFAAIGYGHVLTGPPVSEERWTNFDGPNVQRVCQVHDPGRAGGVGTSWPARGVTWSSRWSIPAACSGRCSLRTTRVPSSSSSV